jgi:hypothetical protein
VTTNTELNAIAAAISGLRNPGAASLQNGDQLIVSIRRPAICLIALPAVLNRLASDLPF